jgi:hypothetical protein
MQVIAFRHVAMVPDEICRSAWADRLGGAADSARDCVGASLPEGSGQSVAELPVFFFQPLDASDRCFETAKK